MKKNIVIWGTGKAAENFIKLLDINQINVIAFVDNNTNKKLFNNIYVVSPNEINNLNYDMIIICSQYYKEIQLQCIELNIFNAFSLNYIINNMSDYHYLFNDKSLQRYSLKKQEEILKYAEENMWRNAFFDTVRGYTWYNVTSLSLGRWAVGYNYAYVLSRVIDSIKPKSILELGLGQSSKIIKSYAQYSDNVQYDIVEQCQEWLDFFSKENDCTKLNIYVRDIIETTKYNGKLFVYNDFNSVIEDKKYSLISIDGPWGGDTISRIDILEYIPDILQDEFVILLDDYSRKGEQLMSILLEKKLKDNNIEFISTTYLGLKDVYIVVSKSLSFLTTL